MVRRRLLVLTITLLILGVMYGSVSAEKTKIVIWTYFAEIHNELLPEFYKQFPDVELEIMSVGGATTAEKYLVAYVGGAGPVSDRRYKPRCRLPQLGCWSVPCPTSPGSQWAVHPSVVPAAGATG
jgi:hypothetical protein